MITDKHLNELIDYLLSWSTQRRVDSNGEWAKSFDCAMAMWEDRHPDTRPPAYAKIGSPPSCFSGTIPPIYEEELD